MVSIYLDILIITNIYVNYFLIKATAKISHTPLRIKRCVLASIIGTISAVTIIFPAINFTLLIAIKAIFSFLIIIIAFQGLNLRRYIRLSVIFTVMGFMFSGVMSAVCQLTEISAIIVYNGSVYFNISLISLIISTIAAYIGVCIITAIFDKHSNSSHSYKVRVDFGGKTYLMNAVSDTGNSLVDSFSGKPVIICCSEELNSQLNINSGYKYHAEEYLALLKNQKSLRLLQYSTIGGEGIIPAFSADRIVIENENHEEKSVDAFIGISCSKHSEAEAIFNPRLLI